MKEILTERQNLFEPNVYITMCVELTGKICLHQLTAAIKEAYKANEATMSRIVLEHGTAYYEKLSVSGCKTVITDKNWIELVRENEKLPFEIGKGELVRTFIIPSDTDTQIMIMAHHLVGDGKSIIYLIRDIMNALAERPLTYKPLVLLNKNFFRTQGYLCLQNYMPITVGVSGKTAFLHGRTTIIYIISIGKQPVPIYNIKRCLFLKRSKS